MVGLPHRLSPSEMLSSASPMLNSGYMVATVTAKSLAA